MQILIDLEHPVLGSRNNVVLRQDGLPDQRGYVTGITQSPQYINIPTRYSSNGYTSAGYTFGGGNMEMELRIVITSSVATPHRHKSRRHGYREAKRNARSPLE